MNKTKLKVKESTDIAYMEECLAKTDPNDIEEIEKCFYRTIFTGEVPAVFFSYCSPVPAWMHTNSDGYVELYYDSAITTEIDENDALLIRSKR